MLHILLVEDNPGDVLMVREGIRASSVPADVTIAYDGEEALKLLTRSSSDFIFILLDLNIPKFSGLELLKRYRGKECPPVVVMTGSENPQDERLARELGASDYAVKPSELEAFIQTVKQIVDRWGTKSTSAAD